MSNEHVYHEAIYSPHESDDPFVSSLEACSCPDDLYASMLGLMEFKLGKRVHLVSQGDIG